MNTILLAYVTQDNQLGKVWENSLSKEGFNVTTPRDFDSKSGLLHFVSQTQTIVVLISRVSVQSSSIKSIIRLAKQHKKQVVLIKVSPGKLDLPHIDATEDLDHAVSRVIEMIAQPPQNHWYKTHRRKLLVGLLCYLMVITAYLLNWMMTTDGLTVEDLRGTQVASGIVITLADNETGFDPSITDSIHTTQESIALEGTVTNDLNDSSRDVSETDVASTLDIASTQTLSQIGIETSDEDNLLDFEVAPTTGVAPLIVQARNNSEGEYIDFHWDFDGDGVVDSSEYDPPSFTYDKAGNYTLTLTGVNQDGSQHVSSIVVQVTDGQSHSSGNTALAHAVVDFEMSATSGIVPLIVDFTNTSDGDFVGYEWDFNGDGVIDSTDSDPSFTFQTAGIFPVQLIAYTEEDYDYAFHEITVNGGSDDDLYADFIANRLTAAAPATILFANESTGNVVSYEWDFNGDGVVDDTSPNPSPYTYTEANTYTARLVITDATHHSSTKLETITILPGQAITGEESNPLSALFYAQPVRGTAPVSVKFTNASSGNISSYNWDFNGDGRTDNSNQTPSTYTYSSPGTYQARLMIQSNDGQSNTHIVTIKVDADETQISDEIGILANFEPSVYEGDVPLTVNFSNQSIGAISQYNWDFDGDGIVDSNGSGDQAFVYELAGYYEVSLTVNATDGSSDTFSIPIVVYDEGISLTADFIPNVFSGDAPLTVTFHNYASGNITAYSWDFDGDGTADSTSSGSPTFIFEEAGVFETKLTVRDSKGSIETQSQIITVNHVPTDEPTPTITPDLSETPSPTMTSTTNISGTTLTATPTITTEFETEIPQTSTQITETALPSAEVTDDPSGTSIATVTATSTVTPTSTSEAMITPPITETGSPTATFTVTQTMTPTATFTSTPTFTPTQSPTATWTPTDEPTEEVDHSSSDSEVTQEPEP